MQAGATKADVASGISGRTYEQWVKNGTEQASKDKVNSTPTVRIDGKTVQFKTIGQVVAAVDKAAAGAS